VPVSRMTTIAAMLIVNPQFPPTTVDELIRYAKANPGKVNFASAGNGTTSHWPANCSRPWPASTSCTCPTAAARWR